MAIKEFSDMDGRLQRIILASASPRRRELMAEAGFDFEVIPADIDESKISAKSPRMLVKKLSLAKAGAIKADGALIIGADTVVVYGGKVFGKPHTAENAKKMLSTLCGKWHSVYTGVSVIYGGKIKCFAVKSHVKLRALNAKEIEECVERTKPFDKAGAYG
ncbi:MAG: Maf family protein, partial [Clostridia bacterium]|nr:Maf family protein [Clostridia bacterium]